MKQNLQALQVSKLVLTSVLYYIPVSGCRAGRIRVIFFLPDHVGPSILLQPPPQEWAQYMRVPLAFVEWYSKFKPDPDPVTMMYAVEKVEDKVGLPRQASIIPVMNIRQCCMLTPNVSLRNPWSRDWESSNILDSCKKLLVSNFQSKYTYRTIYWYSSACYSRRV